MNIYFSKTRLVIYCAIRFGENFSDNFSVPGGKDHLQNHIMSQR